MLTCARLDGSWITGTERNYFLSTFARAPILITNRVYNPTHVLSRPDDAKLPRSDENGCFIVVCSWTRFAFLRLLSFCYVTAHLPEVFVLLFRAL